MNNMSDYDYNEDKICYEKYLNAQSSIFTNLNYSVSFRSMLYCKEKKDKPMH